MSLLNTRIKTSEAVADDRADCRWCNKSTLKATLAEYGARCFACYQDWLDQPIPGRNWPQAGKHPSLVELVERLDVRAAEGERLNRAQREWLEQAKRKLA